VSDYENERDNPGSFKNAETLPAINSVVTKTGSYHMLCLIECICIIEEHHCSAAASYTTKDQGGPVIIVTQIHKVKVYVSHVCTQKCILDI